MTHKRMSDTELDALVVRSLSRLPLHGPSRSFSNKVMNRVALPSPRAVMAWRRARAWALEPRRAFILAGGYAVVAAIALSVAVPWLVRHSPAIAFAYDWTVARAGGLLRDVALGVARWTVSSGVAGVFKSIPLSARSAWALAFGATAAYAGCAVGLHYLLRAPGNKHATAQLS